MSDEAALLRAICDHPDDDTPRLVFADWLTEQGGPVNSAWANAIRAQVWCARGIETREVPLVHFHAGVERVLLPLALPPVRLSEWERGFPTAASDTYPALRAAWHLVAYRWPILKLAVSYLSPDVLCDFLQWPGLERMRVLTLDFPPYDYELVDALPELTRWPALESLRHLTVYGTRVTDEHIDLLLTAPFFSPLTRLRLGCDLIESAPSGNAAERLAARFGPNSIFHHEVIY